MKTVRKVFKNEVLNLVSKGGKVMKGKTGMTAFSNFIIAGLGSLGSAMLLNLFCKDMVDIVKEEFNSEKSEKPEDAV